MQITLKDGSVVLFDEEDKHLVEGRYWYPLAGHKPGSKAYAVTHPYGVMHRMIMNPPKGMVVDHINGNGFDNRRQNLRLCEQWQNRANGSPTAKKGKSGLKGAYRSKDGGSWFSSIGYKSRNYQLNSFPSKEHAAAAYDYCAQRLFGEFAVTNLSLGLIEPGILSSDQILKLETKCQQILCCMKPKRRVRSYKEQMEQYRLRQLKLSPVAGD